MTGVEIVAVATAVVDGVMRLIDALSGGLTPAEASDLRLQVLAQIGARSAAWRSDRDAEVDALIGKR